MGTGKLTPNEEQGMGLVGEHDYAIIDVREHNGQNVFLIKNPWSNGITWKGHVFQDVRLPALNAEGEDQYKALDLGVPQFGTFWMGLNDVFQSFESIYLNWNPALFPIRQDVHFNWNLSSNGSAEGSFVLNPQYVLYSAAGGLVWLLLNRHLTTTQHHSSTDDDAPVPADNEPAFISLYTFNAHGKRVMQSNGATSRSPYVDSPNVLLKMDLPAEAALTVVISEQGLPRSRNAFSLTAFSLSELTLTSAPEKYTHKNTVLGQWTASTAGGNVNHLTYYMNPQFRLHVAEATDLALMLETPAQSLSVHIKVIWAKGRQVKSVSTRDILGDSGEYRKGLATVTIPAVHAGDYTVVCSAFEQGQRGSFTLYAFSMAVCCIEPTVPEGAGRYTGTSQPATFQPNTARLLAPVFSQRLNRVSISARSRGFTSKARLKMFSPLRLSLEYGQGPSKKRLACNNEDMYEDGRGGVRVSEIDIQPDMCDERGIWLVIERLADSKMQENEYIEIDFISEEPIVFGDWGSGDG